MLGLITPLAGVVILLMRMRAGPPGPLMKGLAGKLLLCEDEGWRDLPLSRTHPMSNQNLTHKCSHCPTPHTS